MTDNIDDGMKELIELLKEMGATDVKYKWQSRIDDEIYFTFKNKKVHIWSMSCNDDTGALCVDVTTL